MFLFAFLCVPSFTVSGSALQWWVLQSFFYKSIVYHLYVFVSSPLFAIFGYYPCKAYLFSIFACFYTPTLILPLSIQPCPSCACFLHRRPVWWRDLTHSVTDGSKGLTSLCPSIGWETTSLIDPIFTICVRSFVPIHSSSESSLNVSLVFPPYLLYIPERGAEGRGSAVPFIPTAISSGLPCLSSTFLWTCKQYNIKS